MSKQEVKVIVKSHTAFREVIDDVFRSHNIVSENVGFLEAKLKYEKNSEHFFDLLPFLTDEEKEKATIEKVTGGSLGKGYWFKDTPARINVSSPTQPLRSLSGASPK